MCTDKLGQRQEREDNKLPPPTRLTPCCLARSRVESSSLDRLGLVDLMWLLLLSLLWLGISAAAHRVCVCVLFRWFAHKTRGPREEVDEEEGEGGGGINLARFEPDAQSAGGKSEYERIRIRMRPKLTLMLVLRIKGG